MIIEGPASGRYDGPSNDELLAAWKSRAKWPFLISPYDAERILLRAGLLVVEEYEYVEIRTRLAPAEGPCA